MELVHIGAVVDVLEPGQCFGHPSLLTGLAPAFTVRAREDTVCLSVPREAALALFAHPSGARYIARSLRRRLVLTARVTRGLPDLMTLKVGALVERPPLFVEVGAGAGEAAAAMTRHDVGAALVATPEGLRVVTDALLRARILAAGLSGSAPVELALAPVARVPADRTAGEALVELLDSGARELCVTGTDGELLGLLSIDDLAGGRHSPFALRRAIARAPDEEALVTEMAAGLPRLLSSLLSSGLAPADVGRALAVQSDAATARLIELSLARHGPAPGPWAWLALGSVARREMTPGSDQDNALAYRDDRPGADEYFARLAGEVNAGLTRCGMGEDAAGVLARNPSWRMADSAWVAVFRECLERPDRSHLVRAAVAFDFRHVTGGLDVIEPLVAVLRMARDHPGFLARLARTATDVPVPLNRRGRLAPDRDGRLDLKAGAALPIANLARVHALAHGVTVSSTVERLVAVERAGAVGPETGAALLEAFETVSRIRLEHQAECLRAGHAPDNRVDPGTLAPLRRLALRDALRAVVSAQRQLSVYIPLGM